MAINNSNSTWGSIAKWLHWMVFALLVVQFSIGALIFSLDMYVSDDVKTYLRWVPTHKSIGLTILALVIARLVWRWLQPRPQWPAGMPGWQQRAARVNHVLLYALLLLQPLLGLAQSSAYGATTTFFGLFTVPSIVPAAWSRPNTDVVRLAAQDAHSIVAVLLVVLILVHIAAAIRHQFVSKDGLLLRMLPTFSRR